MWHVVANSREEHAKPWRSQVPPDNGFSLLCCTAAWICMRRVTFFTAAAMLDVAAAVMLLLLHFHSCVTHVAAGTMLHVVAAAMLLLILSCVAAAGAMLLLNSTASVLLILTTPCIPCRTDTKENGCGTCKSRRCYWRTWRPCWWGPRRCRWSRTWCSGGLQRMPYQPQERTEWNCKRSSSKYNMTIYS